MLAWSCSHASTRARCSGVRTSSDEVVTWIPLPPAVAVPLPPERRVRDQEVEGDDQAGQDDAHELPGHDDEEHAGHHAAPGQVRRGG